MHGQPLVAGDVLVVAVRLWCRYGKSLTVYFRDQNHEIVGFRAIAITINRLLRSIQIINCNRQFGTMFVESQRLIFPALAVVSHPAGSLQPRQSLRDLTAANRQKQPAEPLDPHHPSQAG